MEKKREGGDNWTQEEKDLFLQIMTDSAAIIENKKTDTNTNKRKNLEWINVQRKFYELGGKKRDIEQLKGAWRRLRTTAKKRIGEHKRALHATGGGQKPPSPTNEDKIIMDICPTDFVIDENVYDSDGIGKKNLGDKKEEVKVIVEEIYDDESLQLIRPAQPEEAVAEEVVVIAEVHNDEVTISSTPSTYNRTALIPSSVHKQNTEKGSIPKEEIISQNVKKMKRKAELSQKASIIQTNNEVKEQTMQLIKEEYGLKIKFQKQELCHQQLRHKLEIEILMIEKEKKALELQLLKQKM